MSNIIVTLLIVGQVNFLLVGALADTMTVPPANANMIIEKSGLELFVQNLEPSKLDSTNLSVLKREIDSYARSARQYFEAVYNSCMEFGAPEVACARALKSAENIDDRIKETQSGLSTGDLPKSRQILQSLKDQLTGNKIDLASLQSKIIKKDTDKSRTSKMPVLIQESPPDRANYLGSDSETAVSDEIIALAEQLGNDPIEIFNWVYNNVAFEPGFRAVRGNQGVLRDKSGNSIDTSSLLISLLRASDIEARYVFGTVRLSEEQVLSLFPSGMTFDKATDALADTGIPVTIVSTNGQITACIIEHAWVQANLPAYPSRGVRSIGGSQWVDLEPSLKPLSANEALVDFNNLSLVTPEQAEEFSSSISINSSTGEVDLEIGSVFEEILAQSNVLIDEAINSSNSSSYIEIVGSESITERPFPAAINISNYGVSRQTEQIYDALPNSFKTKITLRISSVQQFTGFATEIMNYTNFASSYHGKEVFLRFDPSEQVDIDAIQSFVPGNISDVSQLPSSLPGSLFNVTGHLSIDSETVVSSDPVNLGTQLIYEIALDEGSDGVMDYTGPMVAGEHIAVGFIGGNVTRSSYQNNLSDAQSIAQLMQDGDVENLDKQSIFGNHLSTMINSYYGSIASRLNVVGRTTNVYSKLEPSIGVVGSRLATSYFFGVPRDVVTGGIKMDVGILRVSANSYTQIPNAETRFIVQMGMESSFFEGSIPAEILGSSKGQAEGVSAVSAIRRSITSGAKLYRLDSSTIGTVNKLDISEEAKTDITAMIQVGREVLVPEFGIDVNGVNVLGYIVIDPIDGSGLYLIDVEGSGTTNGAFIAFLIAFGIVYGPILFGLLPALGATLAPILGILALWLYFGNLLTWIGIATQDEFACNLGQAITLGAIFAAIPGIDELIAVIIGASADTFLPDPCEFP